MRPLQVLESTVLHASDQIFWLDGSTADSPSGMRRIDRTLQLALTSAPRDLSVRHGSGRTVLWRRSASSEVAGNTTESDREFDSPGPYSLAGTISDDTGAYLPRAFSLNVGATPPAGQSLILYPAPVAVRFNRGGGLKLTLARDADDTPLPWAIVTATISIPGLGSQICRGQTDRHGDVLLPFLRLPPLPDGIDHYNATLSVSGTIDASATDIADPDDFVALRLGRTNNSQFSQSIGFSVVPGDISTLRSDGRNFLAVKPV